MPKTSIRHSEAQWRTLLDAHRRSGLTIDAFCAREHLATSSFARRRGKLSSPSSFIELPAAVAVPVAAELRIEFDLGSGVVLRILR